MSQAEGFLGRLVGGMIRRAVKRRFRNVYWSKPQAVLNPPVLLYANHHGWMDGYLMYHVVSALGLKSLDWIEEFDAFPLFAKVGGMRFAKNDTSGRVATIRKTIRAMREEKRSLVLFAEGVLHRPTSILPLGRSLAVIAEKVSGVTLIPTAIYYEMSLHERPEAWISLGAPHSFLSLEDCHLRLNGELETLRSRVATNDEFDVLAHGTLDVNERMDLRRWKR